MVRKSLRRALAERQPWERPAEERQGDGDFYPPGASEIDLPLIFGAEKRRIDDPSDDADGRGRSGWPDLAPMEPTESDEEGVRRRILDEGATRGIERLAWYRSYRSATEWGIHIREEAVIGVGAALAAAAPGLRTWEARQAAVNLLLAHEYFHFLVDVAVETLEDVLGAPLYSPWRINVGRRTPPYHLVEEALANAFAYRYGKTRGLANASRRFLRNPPMGTGTSSATSIPTAGPPAFASCSGTSKEWEPEAPRVLRNFPGAARASSTFTARSSARGTCRSGSFANRPHPSSCRSSRRSAVSIAVLDTVINSQDFRTGSESRSSER